MQLLEYEAKALARQAGLRVPKGYLVASRQEVLDHKSELDGRVVVKVQIPAGGRAKAGGVIFTSISDAPGVTEQLVGKTIGAFEVEIVLIEEFVPSKAECYLAVAIDPRSGGPVLLLSSRGGVDVNDFSSQVFSVSISPIVGLQDWHVRLAARRANVPAILTDALIGPAHRAFNLLMQERADLVELNPLLIVDDGEPVAADVRISVANKAMGSANVRSMTDHGFDFIELDAAGDIGLVTTGAGFSLMFVDLLRDSGLHPINFCDLRTGSLRGSSERLREVFRVLGKYPDMKCVAVNVFAGITDISEFARLLVSALHDQPIGLPVMVRIEGRDAESARDFLGRSGLVCVNSLDELVESARSAIGVRHTQSPLRERISSGEAGERSARRKHHPEDVVQPKAEWSGLDWLSIAKAGVVVQGLTGRAAQVHADRMVGYGTRIVAGVVPGRGGSTIINIPVYDTVTEAALATGALTTVAFLPPNSAGAGLLEAVEAGMGLIVSVTEGVATHDLLRAFALARLKGARIIGPNTPGVMIPGHVSLGFLPSTVARPGDCAVLSRSGTLSYEVVWELSRARLGQSVWVVVGGDRVKGSTFADVIPLLASDGRTKRIVLIGEIGGVDEQDAADLIRQFEIPCVALIAGRYAPRNQSMGHAGAIIDGNFDSYEEKVSVLREAGVQIAERPSEVPRVVRKLTE